jgi:mannose-6-phosphate isomerase-like protein (cupin superfamily)
MGNLQNSIRKFQENKSIIKEEDFKMTWIFTYGISMDPEKMKKDIGHYKEFQKAVLKDYIYTFTGKHPDFEHGGTSTIIPLKGGEVLGVAYLIEEDQLQDLLANGYGYVFKKNIAIVSGEEKEVLTLQPKSLEDKNLPAPSYLKAVRQGLIKHYPEIIVDLYLQRALGRVNKEMLIFKKSPSADSYTQEYGTHFRRLFPWRITRLSPFGSAWAILEPGKNTTPHNHDEEETFIFLNGKGEMTIDGHSFPVKKGDVVYLEPFSVHTVKNIGNENLEILCIWWGGYSNS